MQLREVFSFYFTPFALFSPYNGIGFDRSGGPQSPKLRTRIAPNGLRFIVRADERLTTFLELEFVIGASNAWRLLENCTAASPRLGGGVDSVYSVLTARMNRGDGLVGSHSRQSIELFH